jgi:hypothetical protein
MSIISPAGKGGRIFILGNAGLFGLFGPGEIDFTFHGINLFGFFSLFG